MKDASSAVQCAAAASGWCNRAPSEAQSGRDGAEVVAAGLTHDLQNAVNADRCMQGVGLLDSSVSANTMQ